MWYFIPLAMVSGISGVHHVLQSAKGRRCKGELAVIFDSAIAITDVSNIPKMLFLEPQRFSIANAVGLNIITMVTLHWLEKALLSTPNLNYHNHVQSRTRFTMTKTPKNISYWLSTHINDKMVNLWVFHSSQPRMAKPESYLENWALRCGILGIKNPEDLYVFIKC